MKFSPSSSVSSSSTTSFSINLCASSKGNALGCISGFLSRILCSKGLPTYPSDPIHCDEQHRRFVKFQNIVDGSATPNVVARLMGLDYMPEIDSKGVRKDWNLVTRSKSIGSEDFRDKTEEMQGQQRRVKTSVSFRETPTYFELEDDDFFVISFGDKSEKKKMNKSPNLIETEVGIKGCKHRRRGKCRRKQRVNRDEQGKDRVFSDEERINLKISPQNPRNFDRNDDDDHGHDDVSAVSYHLAPLKDKIDSINAKQKIKKGNCLEVSKDEVECVMENSSPVSVLDYCDFISDPEVTASNYSEEDARSRWSESDSGELGCCSSSNNNASNNRGHDRTTEGSEEKKVGLKRRDYKKHENAEMLRRVCRLAEKELSNSSWKYRGMMFTSQELQDTCLDFSQYVFDQLVNDLVDLLVGL